MLLITKVEIQKFFARPRTLEAAYHAFGVKKFYGKNEIVNTRYQRRFDQLLYTLKKHNILSEDDKHRLYTCKGDYVDYQEPLAGGSYLTV